jgi:PIN domain nuclease of toxin-antitoxin system
VKLLLDTHAFLWLVEGSPNLSQAAQAALTDPLNELFLSVASAWEMAIKISNGKLRLSEPLDRFIAKWTATYLLEQVPIQMTHAVAVAALLPHHRDPFDRLLIAQSQIEGMQLVSGDGKFAPYGIPIVW